SQENSVPFVNEFAQCPEELFKIGVVPHVLDAVLLADLPLAYWALGGVPSASTPLNLTNPPRIAHASGSPQGRTPAETGPNGCTLVCADEAARIRLISLPTDAVRWHRERIT